MYFRVLYVLYDMAAQLTKVTWHVSYYRLIYLLTSIKRLNCRPSVRPSRPCVCVCTVNMEPYIMYVLRFSPYVGIVSYILPGKKTQRAKNIF